MTRRLRTLLTAALLLAALPATAQAWKGKGRLEGTVTDQDGKPIEGAVLKFHATKAGGEGPEVKTDKKGRWAYMGLTGGEWKVDVDAAGFLPGQVVLNVSEFSRVPPVEYRLKPIPKQEPQEQVGGGPGLPPEVVAAVKAGNDALEGKRWTEAREAFEKAAPALPDNLSLQMALARAYHGEGNTDKAVESLRRVTAKEPGNNGAWLLIANLLLEKGDLAGGQEALGKVPAEAITDPNVHVNIGVILMNKGKQAEAETYFDKVIAMAPAEGDGYYYRGLSRVAQGTPAKQKEAKGDLEKALQLSPSASWAEEVRQLLKSFK